LTAFAFLSISLLVVPITIACTIFTASKGETVMFGGNEDQRSNTSFLVVNNSGNFGVVYFATPSKQWPLVMQMGINEMGLCYDTNWIPEEKLNPHPERKSQHGWAVTQIMKEASTVEDVLSKIFTYNWGSSISYQVHFADKYGDAVVIHPRTGGELTYTRKPRGNGYLVSTNFNLAKLDKDPNLSLRKRYNTAEEMLSKIVKENVLTVESMASVLKATHQNQLFAKTLYSAVYDLKNLRIYLFYNRQFDAPYVLDVKEELAKTEGYRVVSLKDLISNKNLNTDKN
jgi:penicillin V acylase-like amidase (Ntn superfamily)